MAWDFPVVEGRPSRGGGPELSSEIVSGDGEVASSNLLQEMLERFSGVQVACKKGGGGELMGVRLQRILIKGGVEQSNIH